MRGLYYFHWDCRRSGDLTGAFVADDTEIAELMGKPINFGEVLGKHSEIYGTIEGDDVMLRTQAPDFVDNFERLFPHGIGYNPLEYYDRE